MATFLLTISIYLWGYLPAVEYTVQVDECTAEVVTYYKDLYRPDNRYKAIVVQCR